MKNFDHPNQITSISGAWSNEAWIMMADTSCMKRFEACCLSPRQIVLERIRNLEGDGVGLASPIVESLKLSIDRLLVVPERDLRIRNWSGVQELKRTLQFHSKVSSIDSDLSEELARQGSHVQLLRLLRLDLSTLIGASDDTDDSESYQDALVEIQDIAGEIASLGDRHDFPLALSPFTQDELRQRLPLMFCFDSKCVGSTEDMTPCCAKVVFIHQVTMRQSAQRDVGFGT